MSAEIDNAAGRVCATLSEMLASPKRRRGIHTLWQRRVTADGRKPKSYDAIGSDYAVSGESIRRGSLRAVKEIRSACGGDLDLLAAAAMDRTGQEGNPRLVQTVQRVADLFAGCAADGADQRIAVETAQTLVLEILDWRRLARPDRKHKLSPELAEALRRLKSVVNEHADDAGLVHIDTVVALMGDDAEHLDGLLAASAMGRVGGDAPDDPRHIGRRGDTAGARAKLAVLRLGRPATIAEILEKARLPCTRANTMRLIGLPSVARASKTRWALKDQLDEVYRGIPTAISERIDAGGGSADWKTMRAEIAERFEVSPESVKTFGRSYAYKIAGGRISHADPADIPHRPLSEVAELRDGEIVWEFTVDESYRHLDGFSVQSMPKEIAVAAGCPLDGGQAVLPVTGATEGCKDITLTWRLTSIGGRAELGRACQSLRRLGAQCGDRVSLVIAPDRRSAAFEIVGRAASAEGAR